MWVGGLVARASPSKFFVHLEVLPAARGDSYEYGPSCVVCKRKNRSLLCGVKISQSDALYAAFLDLDCPPPMNLHFH